jgi:riboflavin kinase / FMN adenylyltransferase
VLPNLVDAASLRKDGRPTLVAIGNFDGVHRGHQRVLEQASSLSSESDLVPVVLTFSPHPVEVLGRGKVALLTVLERRLELIARIDARIRVVSWPFDLALAGRRPEEFVRELLVSSLGARVVLVGENFRFGKDRAGDFATLSSLGRELGFEARAAEIAGDASGPFSSSRVREAVESARFAEARAVLGRPHSISGEVVKGDERGRAIGFRTANLAGVDELVPPDGVYATLVDVLAEGRAQRLGCGVTNIGVRPTFGAGRSIETHLLDLEPELYGRRIRVHFLTQLRQERRFSGLDELKAQIQRDIVAARSEHTKVEMDPAAQGAWF